MDSGSGGVCTEAELDAIRAVHGNAPLPSIDLSTSKEEQARQLKMRQLEWSLRVHGKPPRALNTDDTMVSVEVSRLNDLLKCPVCLDFTTDPVTTTNCLHRFCKDCVTTALRWGKKECPFCRMKCSSGRSLRPDHTMDLLVEKLLPERESFEAQQQRVLDAIAKRATSLGDTVREGIKRQRDHSRQHRKLASNSSGTASTNSSTGGGRRMAKGRRRADSGAAAHATNKASSFSSTSTSSSSQRAPRRRSNSSGSTTNSSRTAADTGTTARDQPTRGLTAADAALYPSPSPNASHTLSGILQASGANSELATPFPLIRVLTYPHVVLTPPLCTAPIETDSTKPVDVILYDMKPTSEQPVRYLTFSSRSTLATLDLYLSQNRPASFQFFKGELVSSPSPGNSSQEDISSASAVAAAAAAAASSSS
eukprot:CAMPEP_0174238602 /NCGR_PEP_ID=MMETSP0417-20130205/11954_1 /TAXON_ID=242541 /ORGANISM="Mayorella sp, Strain BSH-02190019" /LENGTH=422 /DNA_ID=CAMNT_0015317459 /DNA_START=185 /DNA_END=1449 /DNA_ORIENTATION=-